MSSKIHILIVDDDKYFRMALSELISDQAIISEADSEEAAKELIDSNFFDIALIDMNIDKESSGLTILEKTKLKRIHSIILSSQTEENIIEEAYEKGCDHFLAKLHYRTHLPPYIHKYKKQILNKDHKKLFNEKYITQDSTLMKQIEEICQINLKSRSLLITGETGVGKSLIGEILHEQTYDKSKPFIHLNCSEISETLIESELFGHKKGSFTGANENKIGKLELANGGTLFLDEIGTMPLKMQQKLLKALDQKTFYPVGSPKEIYSDFTLITATCDDLFELINEKKFRKDLYYRISGINLNIKPLRERPNDISKLIQYFLKQLPRKIIIKPQAVNKLMSMSWDGNIRELKKYIDLLSVKRLGIIKEEDINVSLNSKEQTSYLTKEQKDFIKEYGFRDFISKIELEAIKSSLDRHDGKITHVIKELKISASAFYRIFNKLKES